MYFTVLKPRGYRTRAETIVRLYTVARMDCSVQGLIYTNIRGKPDAYHEKKKRRDTDCQDVISQSRCLRIYIQNVQHPNVRVSKMC